MTINCKGRVNVVTPGTPIPLSTDSTLVATKLFFQVVPGLTGKTYVGRTGSMTKGTLVGVARVLWPNATGGFSETFFIESQDGTNAIRLADYAVDADVAGAKVYWLLTGQSS